MSSMTFTSFEINDIAHHASLLIMLAAMVGLDSIPKPECSIDINLTHFIHIIEWVVIHLV